MFHLVTTSLRADVRRLVSTSITIALGVALLAGTMLFGDTLRANFDQLFASSLGQADAVVRSDTTLSPLAQVTEDVIDGSIADDIAAIDGVDAVIPQIEGFGQLTGADGSRIGGNGPPTNAGNWIDDDDLNPYELVEGRAPVAPDEVVINRGAATDGDLHVGDRTTVSTPEPVAVTIVGIATFGGADGSGPTTFTAFSLAGAEEHVTGRPGEVTSLLVKGDADDLVDRIGARLPDGVEAISGTELADEATSTITDDFVGLLTMFLTAFAAVALVVATFSINNTLTILAAQRERASALLRTIGADRRQVLLTAVGEALLVGIGASLVGLAAGFGLVVGLKAVFDAFGFPLPAGGLTVRPTTVVIAPLVGVLVTLLAALAPAVRASRVAPIAALRGTAVDGSAGSRRRAVGGGVLGLAGLAALVAGAEGGTIALAALGALLFAVGVVALGPVAARPGAAVIGAPIARLRGVPGAMARRNAMRSPRRTAATASALMVGIAVVTLFTSVAESMKDSLDADVGAVVGGDLVLDAGLQFGGGGLSPDVADAVSSVPGVSGVAALATGPVSIDDTTRQVTVVDPASSTGLITPVVEEGRFESLDDDQIAVARPLADDEGWAVGTVVDARFTDGATEALEVGAIYEPSSTIQAIVLPAATWEPHQVRSIDTLVVIGLDERADLAATRDAIEAATAPFDPPDLQTTAEFVTSMTATADQFLGVVYAMLVLAIVIALMGIATTLSLSIHERVREIGLLRAVGASQRQVRSMVRAESVVIAVLGTVAGVGLGLVLGWGVVTAAGQGSFPISFALPLGMLAPIVIVGAAVGVLAARRPARRAARIDVITALATTG